MKDANNDNAACDGVPTCPVEEVYGGSWEGLVETLEERFNITDPKVPSTVRVPSRNEELLPSDIEPD